MSNIPQPPPFIPPQVPEINVTPRRGQPRLPVRNHSQWKKEHYVVVGGVVAIVLVGGIYLLFAKQSRVIQFGESQIRIEEPSRIEKLVKAAGEKIAAPPGWTQEQEVVRKHTRLPHSQILSPIEFHRVKIWNGPTEQGFSKKASQKLYNPSGNDFDTSVWVEPTGEGVLIVALHGDPNGTTPLTKTGYFVDRNLKVRREIDGEDLFVDKKPVDDESFPQFK